MRVSLDKDPSTGTARVIQEDEYYAFGLRKGVTSSSNNRYLYSGKELQESLGQYDYGARFYDPVIGRFHVIDDLAENHYNLTSYHYVMNNPLLYIDPLGLDTVNNNNNNVPVKKDDVILYKDGLSLVASTDEVVVTAPKTENSSTNNDNNQANALPLAVPLVLPRIGGFALPAVAASPAALTVGLVFLPQSMGTNDGLPPDSRELLRQAIVASVLAMEIAEKTADELLPGSLKRSPSYYPPYGNKTRGELERLAKKGDQAAGKMKKLIDQIPRLLEKNKNK
ncbi:hypothetical protein D3C78_1197510 [compost metagenome]